MFFPHLLSGYLDTEFRLRRQVRTLRNLQAITILLNRLDLRSEEHTSELQSQAYLVCRLLLEKKKQNQKNEFSLF